MLLVFDDFRFGVLLGFYFSQYQIAVCGLWGVVGSERARREIKKI
jgi:hypothetical protein